MKLKSAIKRKVVQWIAFGYSNIHLFHFKDGKIYKGKWKQFCNPGLNCYSCPAASLACPIGALQAVNGSINFNFSFYVIGILLAFGVVLGRAICGSKLKLKKGFLLIKYFILVIFVILLPIAATNYMGMGKPAFCQFICPVGTLEGGIPLLSTHAELRHAIGFLFSFKMLILIITIAGCILIYRFFCRTICPLGAIYGCMNKVSICHLEVEKQRCVNCGICKKVCKMEVDPVKTPDSAECIRCGACVAACTNNAISIGFYTKSTRSLKQKEKKQKMHCG